MIRRKFALASFMVLHHQRCDNDDVSHDGDRRAETKTTSTHQDTATKLLLFSWTLLQQKDLVVC